MTGGEALHFYGHGKLLLTGEYFILDGAKGLAIPTRFGQHLRVKDLSGNSGSLYWIALNHLRQPWLNLVFDKTDMACLNAVSPEAQTLTSILTQARMLNPGFLTLTDTSAGLGTDTAVETYLEFPNNWGLGSSATLIYCVARWAGVDAHRLLQMTMGGSGYDIACAGSDSPIVYHLEDGKPLWDLMPFRPPFRDHLFFVHTGHKQLSTAGIRHYRENATEIKACISVLDRLTAGMLECTSLPAMEKIMTEHEELIAGALKLPTAKDTLFPDYWGAVKSLGAWGGDFVMLTNDRPEEELLQYLHRKGLHVVHRFDKMIWKGEVPQADILKSLK